MSSAATGRWRRHVPCHQNHAAVLHWQSGRDRSEPPCHQIKVWARRARLSAIGMGGAMGKDGGRVASQRARII
jgi:hypothetical protein